MKFALVNGRKIEAKKGLTGICPFCGETLIAKCGSIKINHWAHKSKQKCDVWWENETLWHRKWKNNFPIQWQEKILYDDLTGEKHIADVCTNSNLVIEFQHSSIKHEEKLSRDKFYKNILWVVDGTRLKNDYEKFLKGDFRPLGKIQEPMIFLCSNSQKIVSKLWQNSKVPVFFDFAGLEEITDCNNPKFHLFCLLPNRLNNQAIIIRMTKQTFVQNVLNNAILNYLNNLMSDIDKLQIELRKKPSVQRVYTNPLYFPKYRSRRRYRL